MFKDELLDKMIGINTTGRDDKSSDDTHLPYEPTSYAVLDRIIEEGYVTKDNTVVDLGCGKGRVPIYLAKECGCSCVGVDMEKRFIIIAEENARSAEVSGRVSFYTSMAEDFKFSKDMDRFYFFNPFSYNIFRVVLNNICQSFYDKPRDIKLFFYYPSDEYMGRLMTEDSLMFVDEISCMDLFDGKNEREKIVIFEVI